MKNLTLYEVMLLAADHPDYLTHCVGCGEEPTYWGIVLLDGYTPPQVAAGAWCDANDCQDDLSRSAAITIPYPVRPGTDDDALVDRVTEAMTGWVLTEVDVESAESFRANARAAIAVLRATGEAVSP